MHNIPRLDRAARRRLIRRAKKAKDPHTALRYLMIAKLGQGLSRQQVARDLVWCQNTIGANGHDLQPLHVRRGGRLAALTATSGTVW